MLSRGLTLFLVMAFPALADDICDPAKGTGLRVAGVAANDTLNVRSSPTASAKLVARIAPGEAGVSATGRAAWAKGQCTTTCSGAEGGLNDIGRSIAYGCKAKGQIWYEVRTAKGAIGWASAKYLEPGKMVAVPPIAEVPTVEKRLRYSCSPGGAMTVQIYRGGQSADVIIGGRPHLVLRKAHALLPYSFAAGDGARLRGTSDLAEWRWPNGQKTNCFGQ